MSDYDINFAVFCDGPLNNKLSKEYDELYKEYIEKTNAYGHSEDFVCLENWLKSGLNATNAVNHIIEVFRKNYKHFGEYSHLFQTFTTIILNYNPDLESILYSLLTYNDIDDYYPSYLDEYGEEIKIRGQMLDFICNYYCSISKTTNEKQYLIEEVYKYADWSSVHFCTHSVKINAHNCTDVYTSMLKTYSVFLSSC